MKKYVGKIGDNELYTYAKRPKSAAIDMLTFHLHGMTQEAMDQAAETEIEITDPENPSAKPKLYRVSGLRLVFDCYAIERTITKYW
jgi:hypothetical protein